MTKIPCWINEQELLQGMFVVLFHSVNQHVCCYLLPLSPLSMYQNSMKTLIWFLCQSGKQKSLKRSNTQKSPIFEKQFMYPSQNKDTLFTPSFSHFAPMGNSQNVQNFPLHLLGAPLLFYPDSNTGPTLHCFFIHDAAFSSS